MEINYTRLRAIEFNFYRLAKLTGCNEAELYHEFLADYSEGNSWTKSLWFVIEVTLDEKINQTGGDIYAWHDLLNEFYAIGGFDPEGMTDDEIDMKIAELFYKHIDR